MHIGNKNDDSFLMACVKCGATKELTLTAHRNTSGYVTGWLVACECCQENLYHNHFELLENETESSPTHLKGENKEGKSEK